MFGEDFDSPYQEFWEFLEYLPKMERLTGELLAEGIRANFYLRGSSERHKFGSPFTRLSPDLVVPHSKIALELAGLPGSGKHGLEDELKYNMSLWLVTRQAGRSLTLPKEMQSFKEYMREVVYPEERNLVASSRKAWADVIMLNAETSGMNKFTQPWSVTTMGPLGVFCSCLLAEPSATTLLEPARSSPSIRDLLMAGSLEDIATWLETDSYPYLMDTLGGVCMNHIGPEHFEEGRKYRYPTALPIVNGPVLITYINDVSPEQARRFMENPTTERRSPRPYASADWSDEQLMYIRLIHALMVKTDPIAFSVVNREEDPLNFAKRTASEILEHAPRLQHSLTGKTLDEIFWHPYDD